MAFNVGEVEIRENARNDAIGELVIVAGTNRSQPTSAAAGFLKALPAVRFKDLCFEVEHSIAEAAANIEPGPIDWSSNA